MEALPLGHSFSVVIWELNKHLCGEVRGELAAQRSHRKVTTLACQLEEKVVHKEPTER